MTLAYDDPRPRRIKKVFWIVPLVMLDIAALAVLMTRCEEAPEEAPPEPAPAVTNRAPPPNPWSRLSPPTDQQRLLADDLTGVIQPTASGRLESGLYGSVRTAMFGKRLLPSFHEGLDIAPLQRDRSLKPIDKVYAAADGKVAYINRHAGNSNYGIYLVLTHPDPLGSIYTLYAHMASVEPGLKAGQSIRAGDPIGVMGHSSSSPIPVSRAHLHFEIGMINNARFATWFRGQKLKPDHGLYHGRNLLAVDPLRVLRARVNNPDFTFETYLPAIPAAFEVVLPARKKPDYFERYPKLAEPGAFAGAAVVLTCSENGVPLKARAATPEETSRLGKNPARVQTVDEQVLGRNGARIVVRDSTGWRLGENGKRWLEILQYPPK